MKKYLVLWLLCWAWNFPAEASDPFLAIKKTAYPLEDTLPMGVRPNVLFLLDTGSSMSFTSVGILPDKNDGRTTELRRQLIDKGSTYGSGARPYSKQGWESSDAKAQRYGRDLFQENNIIGDLNCYYSPYSDKPYFLTFKNTTWANWNGKSKVPSDMPAELRTYLPGAANAGKPVPAAYTDYLVPNDSRMYQMKLALWRLLGTSNAEAFSGMRVGMAMSYKEDYYPHLNFTADFYFNAEKGKWPIKGPTWAGAGTTAINANTAFKGVDRDYYDKPESSGAWAQVNRARMVVPFDYIYKEKTLTSGAVTYVPTDNLMRFLRYIDGVEEGNGDYFTNHELFADGKTPLATSIFSRHILSGRSDNMGYRAILFAADLSDTYAGVRIRLGLGAFRNKVYITLDHFKVMKSPTSQPELRSGEALGSVIDFFSPPSRFLFVGQDTKSKANTMGYFPVMGSCQPNWLIVFTAADDSSGNYTAEEAATRLFNTSKEGMRGRYWNGYGWDERTFVMDSGIRTLVVGMIDPNVNDSQIAKAKQSLNALARAGNPIMVRDTSGKETYVPNPNAEAYFATDVAGLVTSLKSILTQLTSRPFASGSPVVLPVQTDSGRKVLFSSSYRINALDQWDSWFKKTVLSGDMEAVDAWELNAQKLVPNTQSRKVYTLPHPSGDSRTDVRLLKSMSSKAVHELADVPENKAQDFIQWLHTYNRTQILGDMEYSNPQVAAAGGQLAVYLQTNRGVLHAVDYEKGDELWAFIPPHIFQARLKALKFDSGGNWYAGDGVNSLSSVPHNLLGGPLTVQDTILIGNSGWGGNGLYAMDVTNPTGAPQFLWALENDRYDGGPSKTGKKVATWGKLSHGSGYEKLGLTIAPATFLTTFTAVSAAGNGQKRQKKPIVFLPGGLGYSLGQDDHGKAFYALSPFDGTLLRVFEDGGGFKGPPGSSLGMGITPVTLILGSDPKDDQQALGLVTADSQGNVLYCDTAHPLDQWELKSVFQLQNAGKPVPIPQALSVGTAANSLWVYGGSSELQAPGKDANGKQRGLFNNQNYIFGFNLTKTSGDTALTLADPGMKELKYIQDESPSLPPFGVPVNSKDNKLNASTIKGWALPLRPTLSGGIANRVKTLPEYVVSPPLLYAGTLYVATFIPRVKSSNEDEACPNAGYSKIYALDPLTGAGRWKEKNLGGKGQNTQATLIGNVKITGITLQGNRMYVAVKPLSASALKNLPPQVSENRYVLPDETLWSFELPGEKGKEASASPTVDTNTPYIQYWRDMIHP